MRFIFSVVAVGASAIGVAWAQCIRPPSVPAGCLLDQYEAITGKSNLQCTANDVEISEVTNLAIVAGEECTGPGDNITFTANLEITSNANERYDIGLFMDTTGQSMGGIPLTGACEVFSFECENPDSVDDGDLCGDVSQGVNVFTDVEITAQCITAGTAGISLPYCVGWSVNKNKGFCAGPLEAIPSTPSKCFCNENFAIPGICVINFADAAVDVTCPLSGEAVTEAAVTVPADFILASVDGALSWELFDDGAMVDSGSISDASQAITFSTDLTLNTEYTLVVSGSFGEQVCEATTIFNPTCAGGNGDPHLVGFLGQRFDFTGVDGGNYALLADEPSTLLTMEVHAPIPELPIITYISGIGITAADINGDLHTIRIVVDKPNEFYAHHECPSSMPCLAEGALKVLLDDAPMVGPGVVHLGPGISIGAANIPGECRPFGFENYWARKVREAAIIAETGTIGDARRLTGLRKDMGRWIMDDPAATNKQECIEYVEKALAAGTLFEHEGEHTSFQIVTPELTLRLNHGKLHQLAMRDPTDRFDLPDHRTYQMNIAIERAQLSTYPQGVLGGTVRPMYDDAGEVIMQGIAAIAGSEEDYRVTTPFMADFALNELSPEMEMHD